MITIDLEIPERCGECPCFHAENPMYCQLIKPPDKDRRIVAPYGLPRPEWCPLKEQEPRVMTLEDAAKQEVVWCEDRKTDKIYIVLVSNNMNDSKLYKYGKDWRVWSARPTDEQRKAVKWDG